MANIIVGTGEIGTYLSRVLKDCILIDKMDLRADAVWGEETNMMHICFPYSEEFINQVKKYQKIFNPEYTVIHSTVPPGTSLQLGAVHSPVIGMHPHLEKSLLTFTKFFGGEKAGEVSDYFRRAGIKVYIFDKAETTELMKILDTTFYGLCIEYTKDVKRLADHYKVPFEAWTIWTDRYNEGYEALGHPEYTRPNLVPMMQKIGGHCILPNSEMIDTDFTNIIKKANE